LLSIDTSMEGGSAHMWVADRPEEAGRAIHALRGATIVAPTARSPRTRQNVFASIAFDDASMVRGQVRHGVFLVAFRSRDATRADAADKDGIRRRSRATSPHALLGADSTGSAWKELFRRHPVSSQEFQYALHDRPHGLAGQAHRRSVRDAMPPANRTISFGGPWTSSNRSWMAADHIPVGIDDQDRHFECDEMNGARWLSKSMSATTALRGIVRGPEFGVAAAVGLEGMFPCR
jgi:hypothetical protein